MAAPKDLMAVALMAAALAGCARVPPPALLLNTKGLEPRITLASVPFHPQAAQDDCGPAALAMMLGWSGIDTDLATLAAAVYTPGRAGTLQTDIVQAARRAGRLAAPVGALQDLLRELDAGHPVLVLQNLSFERWPRWHYAVATGYDLDGETLYLHSGREAHFATNFEDFEASWRSSGHWALTVTRPSDLPVSLSAAEGLAAANGLEQAGQDEAAGRAYGALLARWPENLAALMGFGNARYAAGDVESARQAFRQAVTLHPEAAEAWNNLAVSLADDGRHEDALRAAQEAVRLGGPNATVALRTLAELKAATDKREVR
jgi:tetratricopeptide (TPR) repeat protein